MMMSDVLITDLSGEWKIWFDDTADWAAEDIYLPGTALANITVHGPSGGWESLDAGTFIMVPAITDDIRAGYYGVSWWSCTISLSGTKHAAMRFEAARLRVEIFLDGELIGYDLEGYTPFEIAIPDHLNSMGEHRLDVRITNPGGSDNWEDLNPIRWSGKTLPSSQDFGGIWQPVSLIEHNGLRIADLWAHTSLNDQTIMVSAEVEGAGATHASVTVQAPDGSTICVIPYSYDEPQTLIRETVTLDQIVSHAVYNSQLYTVTLAVSNDALCDTATKICAFRELAIRDGGLRYNGDPVYLATSISWNLYQNGPLGSADEIAREIEAIKQLGQNMLTAHRRPANPALIDALDEAGILLYQEPGGLPALRDRMGCGEWLPEGELESAMAFAKLRIERLWRRDRSRASLVWWNLANECLDVGNGYAGEAAKQLMQVARTCDDSRITTWTSGWGPSPAYGADDAEQTASFDFHTVLNWPSIWHPQLDAEIAAVRPDTPMPYISGESQNFGSLAGLGELSAAAAAREVRRNADDRLITWHAALEADLEIIDPAGQLGGADGFCAATADVQTEGVARLIRHHRANPDCDGLAINGWHSHAKIGTMGIVRADRALAVRAVPVAAANASLQVMLQGVRYDVAPGANMQLQPTLLNAQHDAGLAYTLKLTLDGAELCAPIMGTTSGARCDALEAISITIPANASGLMTLQIAGQVGDVAVTDSFRILVTPSGKLELSGLDLFDPRDELSAWGGDAATPWRLGSIAPSLICANNLRMVQTLLDGKSRRSAVLMRPEIPGATNIVGAPGDLAKHGLATADARFVDVKGDWNGGWAFSTGRPDLPSLADAGLWTSPHWRIFPRHMMVGLNGDVITGATSFEEATLYDTGMLRTGATTIILRKNGSELLLTTLPLVDALHHSPFARGVVQDIANWLRVFPIQKKP
jgi:Glycosyl hydrolases family 2, TIM barrel domain